MARELRAALVDDVDGSPATQTIEFTVAGRSWALDLNDAHAREFMTDVMRWTRHARRTDIALGDNRVAARRDPAQTRAIRAWATANGLECPPRGKIPKDVEQAFHDNGGRPVSVPASAPPAADVG